MCTFALFYFSTPGTLIDIYRAAGSPFRQVGKRFQAAAAAEEHVTNPPACSRHNFILIKTTLLHPACIPPLPVPGCLGLFSAAGLQTSLAGRGADLICTPYSCSSKPRAPCVKRRISGQAVRSHMSRSSAFNTELWRAWAWWEMPELKVSISLLGMRSKAHNPSQQRHVRSS